jgi:hypothetical protein
VKQGSPRGPRSRKNGETWGTPTSENLRGPSQILCGVHRPTFRKNGEPGAPLHRLSGLEMENRIDPYSSREEPLLLGLRDGLEILTDVHPQPEVSLIAGRNCGRDRL